MKHFKQKLLCALYIAVLTAALTVSALAAEVAGSMAVWTTESGEIPASLADTLENDLLADGETVRLSSGDKAIALIKKYEGFEPKKNGDYIGYGTQYSWAVDMFPEIASTGRITEPQALAVARDILDNVDIVLNNFAAKYGIVLNQNQFDALADFTYNVGSAWTTGKNKDGSDYQLVALLKGDPANWTEANVQKAFGTWTNGGLGNLPARRQEEATLFVTPVSQTTSPGTETPAPVTGFRDVAESAWYYGYVMDAYARGLMQGDGAGSFMPEQDLTRAQLIQALANLSGESLEPYKVAINGVFPDVTPDKWYSPAVCWGIGWATGRHVVQYAGTQSFGGDDLVTRREMCVYLSRFLRYYDLEPTLEVRPFLDDSGMDTESREALYYCAGLGIIDGVGDGYFAPEGPVTRAQLAKLLLLMKDLLS